MSSAIMRTMFGCSLAEPKHGMSKINANSTVSSFMFIRDLGNPPEVQNAPIAGGLRSGDTEAKEIATTRRQGLIGFVNYAFHFTA